MNQRDLCFDVIRVSGDAITLVFDNPQDTKLAFRAIMSMTSAAPGISLRSKPSYYIVLDRRKQAWDVWRDVITPYTTEVDCATKYKMTLCDGKITKSSVRYPIVAYTAGCP